MTEKKPGPDDIIARVPAESLKSALDITTSKYHYVAAFVAIVFDPVFAITDYYNITASWHTLLYIRLSVSVITLITVIVQKKLDLPAKIIVLVPFVLISIQNAFTYSLIENKDLTGHNLNYMALFIGAAMFLNWPWFYSLSVLIISAIATAYFIGTNDNLTIDQFFINGGLLLITVGVFMLLLIRTRHNFSIKEIRTRLALEITNKEIELQNEEIQAQAEHIKNINGNLEQLVQERTIELERKSQALQEYAFINAHKLRRPVASILGLTNLALKINLSTADQVIIEHLKKSTEELDFIVNAIKETIESADH